MAIGKPGAKNAALLSAAIMAFMDADVAARLDAFGAKQNETEAQLPV